MKAVKGKIAGDFCKEHPERSGPLWRYRVPGMEPGVIDAFLRILGVVQVILSYCEAVSAVLVGSFGYGVCIFLPVQFYDLTVFQRHASSLWFEGSFKL